MQKKYILPTYLPYFFSDHYRKQTIYFFRPYWYLVLLIINNNQSRGHWILVHLFLYHTWLAMSFAITCYYVQVTKPFQCWGYFLPKHMDAKIIENPLNPVMLVFIGKLFWSIFSDEYLCARVSVILQVFASFRIGQISLQQHRGYKICIKFSFL